MNTRFRLTAAILSRTAFPVLLMALVLGAFPVLARAEPEKADTKPFNDFFTAQSAKLYGHLAKAGEYHASLGKEADPNMVRDALAVRASLQACWELFLNVGDMVYVYDLVDPECEKTVRDVGGLLHSGLEVVAGKLDKELGWLKIITNNVKDQPIAFEARQAEKEFAEAAAYFRKAASLFAAEAAADKTAEPDKAANGTGPNGSREGSPQ